MAENRTTIVLRLQRRADGSYFVTADDHPMFSIIGSNLGDALRLAAEVLAEYRTRNGYE